MCDASLRVYPLASLNWAEAVLATLQLPGDLDEALEAARRIFELTERGNPARVYAAYYLALAGAREEAIAVFEEEGSALSDTAYGSVSLFLSRALQGDAEGALPLRHTATRAGRVLDGVPRTVPRGWLSLSSDTSDAARAGSEPAVDRALSTTRFSRPRPVSGQSLRSDPRFAELMRGVKARWEALSKTLPTPRASSVQSRFASLFSISRPLRHTGDVIRNATHCDRHSMQRSP